MDESYSGITRRDLIKKIATLSVFSLAGCLGNNQVDLPGGLSIEWISDTASQYTENHHTMAMTTTDGEPIIALPRNGIYNTDECGVIGIDASGDVLWNNPLPSNQCNAHAIGDIGADDIDGDDKSEFMAATKSSGVLTYDAETGEETNRLDLIDSIAYSAPIAADITGSDSKEIAVVDFAGNLSVVRLNGSIVWRYELDQPVYVTPITGDFTGNGSLNLAISNGRNPTEVVCFDSEGEIIWRTEQERPSLSWSHVKQRDKHLIASAVGNTLVMLDAESGERLWSEEVAHGNAVGEANQTSVYASASDGNVRAFDLATGDVQWNERVTEDGVKMLPPKLGTITDDESFDVAAVAYDGTVAVLDSDSGEPLAGLKLETNIYTHPLLTDISGNGLDDIIVLYGDARVVALSYNQ